MTRYKLFLLPVMILLYTVLTACTRAPVPDAGDNVSSSSASSVQSSIADESDLPEGDFSIGSSGNMQGTVYVKGYARVEQVPEPFCEQNCQMYDYLFLYVMDTGNEEFYELIKAQQGNAYVGTDPPKVGLGCIENRVVTYENHSDTLGRKQSVLSAELSNAILGSSAQAPIILRLSKEPLSTGSGAPACYSHFTTVDTYVPTGASSSAQAAASTGKKCIVAGCSGQLCVPEGDDGVSTCEWKEEYACYKQATCEVQASGDCGWTENPAFVACLKNARSNPQMQAL